MDCCCKEEHNLSQAQTNQQYKMSKFICYSMSIALIAVSFSQVFAIDDEDKAILKEFIEPIFEECSSEHGVSKGDIITAKESYNADALKSCFLGCVLKKTEFMDSKGLFQAEKGFNNMKSLVKNKDDFTNKFEEISKICLKVNDEPVSDGEKGCERAKLALKCALENKMEIPF